jgi:LacI family transcriptional regulator
MATMADVANHAGVTKQTVSNVLTGKAVVREETRQKVLAAIEELGYRPNLIARGLRKGKTSILAIVVPTIANPFYSEIVEEVERVASEAHYNVILSTSRHLTERAHSQLQILADRSIDGLLLLDDHPISHELATVVQGHFPIILCNWEHEPYPDRFPVVGIDYREAGYLAGQHLLDLGHREQTAVIYEAHAHESRLQGFCAALRKSEIELDPQQIIATADSTLKDGYQATWTLLRRQPHPRAIYATNDLMALGSLEALRERGLRVSEDVSLIGSDNILLGEMAYPSLTTIAIPKREMAEEMTRLLLRCIEGETPTPRLLTLLRPYLIVRHSSGSLSQNISK